MTVICCGGSIPPCEQDQKEIQELIIFKEKLKKYLTEKKKSDIINISKKERNW